MDKKENIETAKTGEIRPRIDWSKWDAIFSVAIVAFVIFVPLGGIEYLGGRFSSYPISVFYAFIIGLSMCILIFVFVIVSTVQLLCDWKRYTRRKRLIKTLQIGVPIVFIASFAISVLTPIETYLWQPGYKPSTYGFRDRIRSKADIEAIRAWLRTLDKEDYDDIGVRLPRDEWPKSLKVFNARYVNLDLDENGKPKVRLTWVELFVLWGVEIGMEDMEIPASDFRRFGEYRLPLEPGAYVWHELR